MYRKYLLNGACGGLAAASIFGAPLDLTSVAKDSKWVLHLDVEAFRKTKVGEHFVDKILQSKIDDADELKEMNLSISLQNITSLTAFGPEFSKKGDGVLLVRTTADVKKDLDTLAGLSSLSGGQMFTLTHLNPYPLYSFKSNVFLAPNVGGTVVVAKSKEQIENARQLLLGNGETLARSKTFTEYPAGTNTFFFLGMAEGMEEAQVPAQAQVLKETRGGRLLLGEAGGKVFANLVFKGKDEESSLKIQQVFQGIVALGSMMDDNKDVNDIARATRISSEGNNVTINIQVPIERVVKHLDEEVD